MESPFQMTREGRQPYFDMVKQQNAAPAAREDGVARVTSHRQPSTAIATTACIYTT